MNNLSQCTLRALYIVCYGKGNHVDVYLHQGNGHFYVSDRQEGSVAHIGKFQWDDSIRYVHTELEAAFNLAAQAKRA